MGFAQNIKRFFTGKAGFNGNMIAATDYTFLDELKDGYVVATPEGEVLHRNETARDLLAHISHLPCEEQASRVEVVVTGVGGTQHPMWLTLRHRLKNGMRLWKMERPEWVRAFANVYQQGEFLRSFDLRELFDLAPAGIVFLDQEGRIRVYNETFLRRFTTRDTLDLSTPLTELLSYDTREDFQQLFQRIISGERQVQTIDLTFWGREAMAALAYIGGMRRITIEGEEGPLQGLALYIFDHTEQRTIQLRLLQSQKLQAMGQLAGGIAHDFNNLLTAMIGFCDLLLLRHTPGDHSFTDIMQIKQNANRAANLVRQLLAFSRQQTLQPKILDISETLANLSLLLQRLIGPSMNLRIMHGRDLGLVRVDQGQFEQVIINLVVNARDAIQDHGEITIKTSNKTYREEKQVGHELVPVGSYVAIEVIDNGCGIQPVILENIFDPFFSTKEAGYGTGLGLSTVYGIVKQTGGHIVVESEVGKGTKFSIYLPRHAMTENERLAQQNQSAEELPKDLTGSGTILLVEDEEAVRIFSARALRDKGYHVYEAGTGEQGLAFVKDHLASGQKLDLMITDVVMPQMDGPTMAQEVLKLLPDLPVIFISGYAEDSFRRQLDQRSSDMHFLAKPFSLQALAQKVKEVMPPAKKSSGGARTAKTSIS
ncbi:MAG: ATP-binding protein [Holosporales bacterium]